ncbi:MAG: hypothetical protein D6769_02765 [Methanobacteriota archaeon]|nr:MAG: hypothetical protein D6769_02765 [Euryarchaeota archaeon]
MKQTLLENPDIVVDVNEPREIREMLENRGSNIVVRKLAVADYVIGKLALERKKCEDFHSSIVDGRLFRQAEELRENYEHRAIIVEGVCEGGVSDVAVAAAKARLLDMGISLMWSANIEETATILAAMTKLKDKERTVIVLKKKPKTREEQVISAVASLPMVGTVLAKLLLKRFGTIKMLANATKEELMEVEGVGEKRAGEIIRVFNSKIEGS